MHEDSILGIYDALDIRDGLMEGLITLGLGDVISMLVHLQSFLLRGKIFYMYSNSLQLQCPYAKFIHGYWTGNYLMEGKKLRVIMQASDFCSYSCPQKFVIYICLNVWGQCSSA